MNESGQKLLRLTKSCKCITIQVLKIKRLIPCYNNKQDEVNVMTDMNQYLEECLPEVLSEQDMGARNIETKVRHEAVVIRHLGLDGDGGKPFSAICKSKENPDPEFPFTKQMASSVVMRYKNHFKEVFVKCDVLQKAINLINKYKPCSAEFIEQQLLDAGLTEINFKIAGIFNAVSLFDLEDDIGYLVKHGGRQFVLNDLYKEAPKDTLLLAIKDVSTNGASNIDELVDDINHVFEIRKLLLQVEPEESKKLIEDEKYLEFPKAKLTTQEVESGKLPKVDALEEPLRKELLKVFGRKRSGKTYGNAKNVLMTIIGRGRVKISDDIPDIKGISRSTVKSIVVSAIQTREDFVWLCREKGWFYFSNIPRNRLLTRVQKMFSIVRVAPIRNIREGLIRAYRGWGIVPPEGVVLDLLESTGHFNINEDKQVELKANLDDDVLSMYDKSVTFENRPSELDIIQCILTSDNGFRYEKEMEELLIDFDNPKTYHSEKYQFSMNLNFSPVLRRETRGVYTLVGTPY